METTIRKIGNSVGAIIPQQLNAQVGMKYKVLEIDGSFVLTPLKADLFVDKEEWAGFRDSLNLEDQEWDDIED